MRNFQIVNGGQTTASILSASDNRYRTNHKLIDKIDISKIFVQMKLSVIEKSHNTAADESGNIAEDDMMFLTMIV